MKVSQLKKNPNNPREIRDEKFEKLKKSISEFPQMMELRPIVVDADNTVLGGNMRLAAIKSLGMKEIPDEWVKRADDLTDEQVQRFIIADNVGFGEWDWETLANEWDSEQLTEWGLDIPGFETVEPATENDAEPQIDKAAELNEKWQVQAGDLWQIGGHRLLCGDSTKREDVDRLMEGATAHMMFTDPPYNVNYVGKTEDALTIENDNMSDEAFMLFLINMLSAVPIREGGTFYLCSPAGNTETDFRIAVRSVPGLLLKQCIVWVKDQFVMGRQDYHWRHESILYGWKEGAAHYFVDDRTQDTVWEIERPKANREHPTMKPLEVPSKGIANSSKQGDSVYEPFAGSGTTLVACQNLNRKCYAVEISPNYCAVILERMATAFPDIEIKRIEGVEAAKS